MFEWILILIVAGYLWVAILAFIDLTPAVMMTNPDLTATFRDIARFLFLVVGAIVWDLARLGVYDTMTFITIWDFLQNQIIHL